MAALGVKEARGARERDRAQQPLRRASDPHTRLKLLPRAATSSPSLQLMAAAARSCRALRGLLLTTSVLLLALARCGSGARPRLVIEEPRRRAAGGANLQPARVRGVQ